MPTPSVYIAVPSYQGIMGDTVSTIIYTMHDLAARGIPASFNPLEGHAILEIARAELVAGFLRSSASHMLFIDADTWFEASLVGRLLDADRDVVAVVSRSRRPPHRYPIMGARDGNFQASLGADGSLLLEIEGTGLATALIHRKVFEKLRDLHPELAYRSHLGPGDAVAYFNMLMVERTSGRRDMLPEDYAFFTRIRAAGFTTYLYPNAETKHSGFRGQFSDLLEPQPDGTYHATLSPLGDEHGTLAFL